jgi:hypothetical protein
MTATATRSAAKPAAIDPATASGADLKKAIEPLNKPPLNPVLVDVPELGYMMIDGHGAPEPRLGDEPTELQRSFTALFPVVYTIKFRLKRDGLVMPILPLEALWFIEGDSFDMSAPKDEWNWRVLMAVSHDVTPAIFDEAVAEVRRKKGDSKPLAKLRFERWREGRCAQVMHVGPYSAEGPTIERLHAFIADQGLRMRGAHHEIYLGDPRTADPAKLKTVLRQPIE